MNPERDVQPDLQGTADGGREPFHQRDVSRVAQRITARIRSEPKIEPDDGT